MAQHEIDWSTFGKTRPLTIEDLRRYNAADLDPYTVQLAQALCEQFAFAPQGNKNLSFALSALSEGQPGQGVFEIGFGLHHVINTTLKSDTGFVLTSIIGVLTEYYKEDFVVEFFKLLSKRSNVPDRLNPIEAQWQKMVDVLNGVLSISPFGLMLASFEEVCPSGLQPAQPSTILDALTLLCNHARNTVRKPIELTVGADVVWIASVAQWLFDFKITILSQAQVSIYKSQGLQDERDASVILKLSGSSSKAVSASRTSFEGDDLASPDADMITGGRLNFNELFRATFRDAFSSLSENRLAAYLASAAHILEDSIATTGKESRQIFLGQTSEIPGMLKHGLIETISAWFPEIERLKPKIKQERRANIGESRRVFDEKVREFHDRCICNTCRSDLSSSTEICKVTLAEVIVSLGLNVARMVVSPRLLPKRGGVLAFYQRHHEIRRKRLASHSGSPSEDFVTTFVETMPKDNHIIEIGFMLFADALVYAAENVMGMSGFGLTVFLNGRGEVQTQSNTGGKVFFVGVAIVPGWLCLCGHEAKLEVFDKGVRDWTRGQAWDWWGHKPGEFRQILKWSGNTVLSSIIGNDPQEEQRARAAGWVVA